MLRVKYTFSNKHISCCRILPAVGSIAINRSWRNTRFFPLDWELVQTLIPLYCRTNQESPRTPESGQTALILDLRRGWGCWTEGTTELMESVLYLFYYGYIKIWIGLEIETHCKANSADKIPESYMPPKNFRSWNIPFRLCLDGKK